MSAMHGRTTQEFELPSGAIADFCRKWRIAKLELFGSAMRDDFGAESDVDFLVSFDQDARWSLFDLVDAEDELTDIVGRTVDLVERGPIEVSSNWIRRKAILERVRTVYVA